MASKDKITLILDEATLQSIEGCTPLFNQLASKKVHFRMRSTGSLLLYRIADGATRDQRGGFSRDFEARVDGDPST